MSSTEPNTSFQLAIIQLMLSEYPATFTEQEIRVAMRENRAAPVVDALHRLESQGLVTSHSGLVRLSLAARHFDRLLGQVDRPHD